VVWRRLVAAADWPQWCPNIQDVKFLRGSNRLLDQNSRFAFETLGRRIHATVDEFIPYSRLGWFATNTEITVYQAWLLLPRADNCQVVTEIAANGPRAIAIRETEPQALHRNNELWLRALKRVSEREA
jgi:hypothetical protein